MEFMAFEAPVGDIAFTLRLAGLDGLMADGLFPDLTPDLAGAVLEEAGRFATEVIAPLNRIGDRQGARLGNGGIRMPDGFHAAYEAWVAGGWGSVTAPPEFGGQDLPLMLGTAVQEMWNSAAMSFGLGTLLTTGAVEAVHRHGSEELKRLYLGKLASGEWAGTMNLTEPQAGSDLGALSTRAERAGDGTYRIFGTKIYITYGEHDLTPNIVHLVLARLPDAPPGTRGISLFLVPKRLVEEDGSLGARNDLRCAGIEHKLGIHASPTCTMVYGEREGAVGYLVGEENRGLACMFTMMNNARLLVGIQGVAIAERAAQAAASFARERRQGRSPGAAGLGMSPIAEHPDVARMLLTMRALTAAARALCYSCAEALDRARREPDPARRDAAALRANLLTPVAKAFSTDIGVEVASLGVQVHGGMGYVEETGAAQHLRDARILPIYEGTNGIQAIDLAMRKLPLGEGAAVRALVAGFETTAERVRSSNRPELGRTGERLAEAVAALREATEWMIEAGRAEPAQALAGATPYLRLFGLTAGGAYLAGGALTALTTDDGAGSALLARFYAENLLTAADGLRQTVTEGGAAVLAALPARLQG